MPLKDHKNKFHPDIYAELVELGQLYTESFFGNKEVSDVLRIRVSTNNFRPDDQIAMAGDMFMVSTINDDGTIDLLRIGNAQQEGTSI